MRPEFVRTKINLARILNEREFYGEALAAADGAVVMAPDNALAPYLRGRSLAHLGRVQDARAALRTSLGLDPENGDVWNRLGLLLLRHGEIHEAVTVLETAVSLNPEPAYIQNNLARVWALLGGPGDVPSGIPAAAGTKGPACHGLEVVDIAEHQGQFHEKIGLATQAPLQTADGFQGQFHIAVVVIASAMVIMIHPGDRQAAAGVGSEAGIDLVKHPVDRCRPLHNGVIVTKTDLHIGHETQLGMHLAQVPMDAADALIGIRRQADAGTPTLQSPAAGEGRSGSKSHGHEYEDQFALQESSPCLAGRAPRRRPRLMMRFRRSA